MRVFFFCSLLLTSPVVAMQDSLAGGALVGRPAGLVPGLYPGLIALIGAFGQRIFLHEGQFTGLLQLRLILPTDLVPVIAEYLQELFIGAIGGEYTPQTQFNSPDIPTFFRDGRFIVQDYDDTRARVRLFDPFGTLIRELDIRHFYGAAGFRDGRIAVIDGHRVQLLEQNGRLIGFIRYNGVDGRPTEFLSLTAIAITSDDRMLVLDNIANRVHLFDPGGNFIRFLGNGAHHFQARLNWATGIAIFPDERILVTGRMNRMQLFNTEGDFIEFFGDRIAGVVAGIFPDSRVLVRGIQGAEYMYIFFDRSGEAINFSRRRQQDIQEFKEFYSDIRMVVMANGILVIVEGNILRFLNL